VTVFGSTLPLLSRSSVVIFFVVFIAIGFIVFIVVTVPLVILIVARFV
jgi:hypothetical protein